MPPFCCRESRHYDLCALLGEEACDVNDEVGGAGGVAFEGYVWSEADREVAVEDSPRLVV